MKPRPPPLAIDRRRFLALSAGATAAVWAGCSADDPALTSRPGITSIHEHIDGPGAAARLLEAMDRAGIARANLVGAYSSLLRRRQTADLGSGAANNDLVLQAAADHPDRFTAFVLLDGTEPDPVDALRRYLARGARGVKLYNGVAQKYRAMPLDDGRLAPLYRFCELHGLPILAHVDPPHLAEFLRVVRDHPSIPWICPHLLTLTSAENIDRLGRILTRFPRLSTDMCFGFEGWMHRSLERISASAPRLRELFIRHADQILFGTDIVVVSGAKHRTADWATNSLLEYRKLLELERFHHRVQSRSEVYEADLTGLALPADALQAIYVDNAARILDRPPARVDRDDLHLLRAALPSAVGSGAGRLVAVDAVARALGAVPRVVDDLASLRRAAALDPDLVAILPLDALDAGLRALPVNGVHPWQGAIARCAAAREARCEAALPGYPLLLPCDPAGPALDLHELRTVVLTGSSLFGAGMTDEDAGPAAITGEVADIVRDADAAHLSNEDVLRAPCAQDLERWRFCYPPEWLHALELLGVDALDLTGNHLGDWKRADTRRTLAAYAEREVALFGGGDDLSAALRPAIVPIRGVNIGFVGVNHVSSQAGSAGDDQPGPLVPGPDGARFTRALAAARAESDVFFCTYQGGYEFSPTPWNDMVSHAHQAIAAGAVAVAGVHAHAPMGVEVKDGALVAYGLGNFLFRHPATAPPHEPASETGLLLRATLIGARLLQTELLPVRFTGSSLLRLRGPQAAAVRARVAAGSQPGLAPERAAPLCDAFVRVTDAAQDKSVWRAFSRVGMRGALVGLSDEAAAALDSTAAELAELDALRARLARRGGGGLRLAITPRTGEALPPQGFDALRLALPRDRALLPVAAAAGVPVQLTVGAGVDAAALDRWLGALPGPVVLSGLGTLHARRDALSALLRRHPGLHVDTSAASAALLGRWFASMDADPAGWAAFVEAHADRLLAATGVLGSQASMGWHQHTRLLRALRWGLERTRYRRPVFSRGEQSEWSGYDYAAEPEVTGLGLAPSFVDQVLRANFERLWPPR